MKASGYELKKESFLPIIAAIVMALGVGCVLILRNWFWGGLSLANGIVLAVGGTAFIVMTFLVWLKVLRGEFMLIPSVITAVGMLLNSINMLLVKGSFDYRVELLIFALFVVMLLIMIASRRGRAAFPYKKAGIICIVITVLALILACVPLIGLAFENASALDEFLQVNLPCVLFFAAYAVYFYAMEEN